MKENKTDRKRLSDAFAALRSQGFDALKKEDRGLNALPFGQVRSGPYPADDFNASGRLLGFGRVHCCADPRTRAAVVAALSAAGFAVFDRTGWDLGSIVFARDASELTALVATFQAEAAAWPEMLEGLSVDALADRRTEARRLLSDVDRVTFDALDADGWNGTLDELLTTVAALAA